ncbi:MAG: phosphotransferase family protein [Pseudomonadota bacterium]|nr:phosphotransferase family protein [Pseudomonadota bacterium]
MTTPTLAAAASMERAPAMPQNELDVVALERWMAANVSGYCGPAVLAKFPGGQSNPTYRIDTPSCTYVMRRKPFGPLLPSAHAVEREFRVITALKPLRFPVPKTYGLCTDASIIGAAFYVMDLVPGRTLWDGALPGMKSTERREIYTSMIDVLARLHSVEPTAIGLGDFGRTGNYFERQIARWTKQFRASETEHIEEVERMIAWLPRTLPAQDRTCIVHGDYRIDNLIFHSDGAELLAVLDWELSTLGDPLADFCYFLMNWVSTYEGGSGIGGLDHRSMGIPTLDETVSRYCAVTGRDGVPDLNWYFAFNLFRLTAILQGIRKRVIDGNASSEKAALKAQRVRPLAQQAWVFAQKAGAQ